MKHMRKLFLFLFAAVVVGVALVLGASVIGTTHEVRFYTVTVSEEPDAYTYDHTLCFDSYAYDDAQATEPSPPAFGYKDLGTMPTAQTPVTRFVGWYNEPDSDPRRVTPFDFVNTYIHADLSLYAKFDETLVRVRFRSAEGEIVRGGEIVREIGDTLLQSQSDVPPPPLRNGAQAVWRTLDGKELDEFPTMTQTTPPILIFWAVPRDALFVYYFSEGTQIAPPNPYFLDDNDDPVLPPAANPTRDGFEFLYWSRFSPSEADKRSGVKGGADDFFFKNTASPVLRPNAERKITESILLYAVWKPTTADYAVVYWLEKPNLNQNNAQPGVNGNTSPTLTATQYQNTENYIFGTQFQNRFNATATAAKITSGAAIGITNTAVTVDGKTLFALTYANMWRPDVPNANGNAFEYDHTAVNTETVLGDGGTVFNIYLRRKVFTLNFIARSGNTNYTLTFRPAYGGRVIAAGGTYSFQAKYEQNIDALWPSDKTCTSSLATWRGWALNINSATANTATSSHRTVLGANDIPQTGAAWAAAATLYSYTGANFEWFLLNYYYEALPETDYGDTPFITYHANVASRTDREKAFLTGLSIPDGTRFYRDDTASYLSHNSAPVGEGGVTGINTKAFKMIETGVTPPANDPAGWKTAWNAGQARPYTIGSVGVNSETNPHQEILPLMRTRVKLTFRNDNIGKDLSVQTLLYGEKLDRYMPGGGAYVAPPGHETYTDNQGLAHKFFRWTLDREGNIPYTQASGIIMTGDKIIYAQYVTETATLHFFDVPGSATLLADGVTPLTITVQQGKTSGVPTRYVKGKQYLGGEEVAKGTQGAVEFRYWVYEDTGITFDGTFQVYEDKNILAIWSPARYRVEFYDVNNDEPSIGTGNFTSSYVQVAARDVYTPGGSNTIARSGMVWNEIAKTFEFARSMPISRLPDRFATWIYAETLGDAGPEPGFLNDPANVKLFNAGTPVTYGQDIDEDGKVINPQTKAFRVYAAYLPPKVILRDPILNHETKSGWDIWFRMEDDLVPKEVNIDGTAYVVAANALVGDTTWYQFHYPSTVPDDMRLPFQVTQVEPKADASAITHMAWYGLPNAVQVWQENANAVIGLKEIYKYVITDSTNADSTPLSVFDGTIDIKRIEGSLFPGSDQLRYHLDGVAYFAEIGAEVGGYYPVTLPNVKSAPATVTIDIVNSSGVQKSNTVNAYWVPVGLLPLA